MKLTLALFFFVFLATVLARVAADDLAALKETLQKLCAANTERAFGTCCASNNNGQDITAIGILPSCFGSVATTSGYIDKLFASNVMRSFRTNLEIISVLCLKRN